MSTPAPTITTLETDAAASLLSGPWLRTGIAVVLSAALLGLLYTVVMAESFGNATALAWLTAWGRDLHDLLWPVLLAAGTYIAGWLRKSPLAGA